MSITEGELLTLIDIGEAEGTFDPSEAELLRDVFRFGDRQVREVMTPRPEMVGVQRDATLSEFLAVYDDHSHTRFPVYNESSDDIIGILSSKDVLRAMARNGGMALDASVTETLSVTPSSCPRRSGRQRCSRRCARTVTRWLSSWTSTEASPGLVTLKRLSEEVVGAHGEEDEAPEDEYESLDENTFQLEAAMSIGRSK